jgi:hypothetical protein
LFKGVLVSDFYAAYDCIPCAQQKCCPRTCACQKLCLAFKGILQRPRNNMPLSSRWYRPYCLREARHLLRDNPVHLNIATFGFTKPSESKNPSRRLVHLLRSPGGQFPRINPDGVF